MADQEHTNNPLLCLLTIIGCFFIQCWQRILQEFSILILQRLLALPQHPNVEIFLHQSNAPLRCRASHVHFIFRAIFLPDNHAWRLGEDVSWIHWIWVETSRASAFAALEVGHSTSRTETKKEGAGNFSWLEGNVTCRMGEVARSPVNFNES